ncbi:MAG: AAA family ATPase [Patescibacteria group bacterium]|nr:MAG: AAA family ATPase [Patescibacteria group bacterium]
MKQKDALKILKAGRNVYLTGAAGSGKTHVLGEYITYLKHRGICVGVTASTGIAATHIDGVTIHSWSGVGVRDTLSEAQIDELVQKEYLWKRFDKARVLVIDEVSMLSSRLFDTVECVCRAMKGCEEPFGGMQVVLSGDFFQLPPIVRDGSSAEFANASDAWKSMDIRVCYLDEQFRHRDSTLENILNEMRGGTISRRTRDLLRRQTKKSFEQGIVPTRLYTHNADVDAENDRELARLPGKEYAFPMQTKGKRNIVETLKKSILAPEVLTLKKDAVVMFVKNNFEDGYVNGTLGVVEEFDGSTPVVKTLSGKRIHVRTVEWTVEEDGKVKARVEQLPLRLAWAITVHKSQGMSMDAAEIDLSKSFVPGQGYVALSRLRTLAGLVLRGMNDMALACHPEVANMDKHLLSESKKWEQVIARFDEKQMEQMHAEFVRKCGGTADEKEIAKNRKSSAEKPAERVSTYEKTRRLIEEKQTLLEIAQARGQTLGTILSHFEKLKEDDTKLDLSKFKPKMRDLKAMKDAFKKTGDTKLTPVHRKLRGKYSYEQLRLARLFL